jgi:type IV pilus assembly protein PilF
LISLLLFSDEIYSIYRGAVSAVCGRLCKSRRIESQNKSLLSHAIGHDTLNERHVPASPTRIDGDSAVIQNNLGLAFLVREKFDEAERRFLKAISLKEDYTDAKNNLGRLYVDVGLYKKAISVLEPATNDLTYEQPEKTWSNLGLAFFMSGNYSKAKESFQKSLRDRKDSCFTMNYYGRSLFELKNYRPAAESLDRAVKLCEKDEFEEPHFYSGLSYFKLGEVDLARARLNAMIQLFPKGRLSKQAKDMLETIK